mgnify:CR=1 FL=1|tara:strand:+ start:536 stop:658 length:123 start_codon:yes stop_codon:yes gene_type:complete
MENKVNHLKRQEQVMKEIENMNNTYKNQLKKLTKNKQNGN